MFSNQCQIKTLGDAFYAIKNSRNLSLFAQ